MNPVFVVAMLMYLLRDAAHNKEWRIAGQAR